MAQCSKSYLGTERPAPPPERHAAHDDSRNLLKLSRTSAEFPRRFLPRAIDCTDWKALKPFADELISRKIGTAGRLRRWMDNYLEFLNAVYEERSRLYVSMTCDTADKTKSRAYLGYVKNLEPRFEQFIDLCNRKIRRHPLKTTLKKRCFGKWLGSLAAQMRLFNVKNLRLQPEIFKWSHSYQKTCGAMTVQWDSASRTVVQMNRVLQEPVRQRREQAWRRTWNRFIDDRQRLDAIFNRLFRLRSRLAGNLRLADYREYCFKKYERTDYSVKECHVFHNTVEKTVVPLYRQILQYRKSELGLQTLRPWDLACDVRNRPELRPFRRGRELIAGVDAILRKLDPELHGYFRVMQDKGLLDLENRLGKAPGGYQIVLDECRLPFIFMNAVGSNQDVFTLLHESGHAMHTFLCRNFAHSYDREPPKEFCEVASMSMERFGMDFLSAFYSEDDAARAATSQNEEVFRLFAWVAIIDSFQHWIYTHPRHTGESRNRAWMETMERFQAGLDWQDLDNYRKTSWHRQLHIFQYPFYYIEYGIALIGALQMWLQFRKNRKTALARYKAALGRGGTIGLRRLFETAGLAFDFSERTVEPLVCAVYEDWLKLRSR